MRWVYLAVAILCEVTATLSLRQATVTGRRRWYVSVVAGYLARAVFQGTAQPLEAADGGYLSAASDAPAAHVLSDALGTRFRMLDVLV